MRMRLLGFAMAGLFCTGLSTLVGCGSDCGNGTIDNGEGQCIPATGLTCGEGTQLVNGVCQPTSSICGRGTRLEGDRCVPDTATSACGSGTTYDTATGTCIGNGSIRCGENTTQVNNVCTAPAPGGATCGAGTVLDNGQCVPDGSSCGEGTAIINGVCSPGALFQFVHNVPDAAAATVDVYVDGTRIADNLSYRNATRFLGILTDGTVEVALTAPDAADASSPLFTTTVTADIGDIFTIVFNGDGAGNTTLARVSAKRVGNPGELNVAFVNGAFNYTPFSLFINFQDLITASYHPSGTPLAYGQFTASPVVLPSVTAAFDVFSGSISSTRLGSFQTSSGTALPIVTTPSTTTGSALVVIASGVQGGAPDRAVGFYGVPPSGGAFLPLDRAAHVQFINAESAARDIYVGQELYIGQLGGGLANRYIAVVSGAELVVASHVDDPTKQAFGVTPPSTGQLDTDTVTFGADASYAYVLNDGTVSRIDGREAGSAASSFDIVAFNGTSVTGDIDADGTTLGSGVATASFSTTGYVSLPLGGYTVSFDGPILGQSFPVTLSASNAGILVFTGNGGAGTDATLYYPNGDASSL